VKFRARHVLAVIDRIAHGVVVNRNLYEILEPRAIAIGVLKITAM
jgi:hypothetical protein